MAVYRYLPEFDRQRIGSFRCWMKLITLRAWRRHVRKEFRTLARDRLLEADRCPLFGNSESEEGGKLDHLDRIADAEIYELALDQVRRRVSEEVWDIFESSQLRLEPITKIAEKRGISETAVRVNNFRVRKLLREFVTRLESK